MSSSQDRDYLTSLPTELLARVIAEVPISSYLDITHTSRILRDFIKTNAARLCNEVIRSQHSVAAEYFKSEMVDGWLLPTMEELESEEVSYMQRTYSYLRWLEEKGRMVQRQGLLGQIPFPGCAENWETCIRITDPGPQYVHFLESQILQLCGGNHKAGAPCLSCMKLFGVGKGDMGIKLYLRDFPAFMNKFNHFFGKVMDERSSRRKRVATATKVPRGIMWYYGVDKLMIYNKGEAQCFMWEA
jgi:hypothetical protein